MSLSLELTLDPATQEALSRLVAQIPDAAAIAYAHSTPAFAAGGFRLNRAALIRARIGQIALATEVIEEPLRRLLARYSLNASVVAPLSVSFLNDHAAALSDLFGPVPMRLARLLDDRAAVREREADTPPPAAEAAGAAEDPERSARGARILHEHLAGLLDMVGAGAPAGDGNPAPGARAGSGEVRARLEEQLREARHALRGLKGSEARAGRLQTQLEACQEELRRAQAAQAAAAALGALGAGVQQLAAQITSLGTAATEGTTAAKEGATKAIAAANATINAVNSFGSAITSALNNLEVRIENLEAGL